MSQNDDSDDQEEWLIHRFRCPKCGNTAHADKAIKCFRDGSDMEQVTQVGKIEVPVDAV